MARATKLQLVRSAARSANLALRRAPSGAGFQRTGGYYGRFAGKGAELKFFDTALTFSLDTTGEVPATGQLVLILQGTTESQRIGRKCVIKSVQIKAHMVYGPGAGATAATTGFLYLVLDKQTNGAAAAVTDVLTSNNLAVALTNVANSERFVIMKKWTWQFNPPAGATTAYNNVVNDMEFYKKCNIPIEYSSTTGAITEIRSNNLFFLSGAIGSDDLVDVTGTVRVRFSDS